MLFPTNQLRLGAKLLFWKFKWTISHPKSGYECPEWVWATRPQVWFLGKGKVQLKISSLFALQKNRWFTNNLKSYPNNGECHLPKEGSNPPQESWTPIFRYTLTMFRSVKPPLIPHEIPWWNPIYYIYWLRIPWNPTKSHEIPLDPMKSPENPQCSRWSPHEFPMNSSSKAPNRPPRCPAAARHCARPDRRWNPQWPRGSKRGSQGKHDKNHYFYVVNHLYIYIYC